MKEELNNTKEQEMKEYIVYRCPNGEILLDWNGNLWKCGYPFYGKSRCIEIERGKSKGGKALPALYALMKKKYGVGKNGGMTVNDETRFRERKAHLINFHCLTEVMQELLDDKTLEIERDYPILSFYSSTHDCCYEEEEIRERIGDYLGITIAESFMFTDSEVVYFIEDK